MPIDPQARAVLDLLDRMPEIDLATVSPPTLRARFDSMKIAAPVEEVAEVEDIHAPGPGGDLRMRVYRARSERPSPALVYFHGGGFVIGSLDSHDGTCRDLARAADCTVVSVDYRLAPESPFPAAPEDCYSATCWIAEQAADLGVDPRGIAVGGDSAGGNLAAVTALLCRDREGPELCHQLLIYPVTCHGTETASYRENGEGYMLTAAMMQWFWGHYLDEPGRGSDPLASPLLADSLTGLPPATLITAEFDPLRDEGEAYGKRLADAGVPTRLTRYDGMFHGFFSMPAAIDRARVAIADVGQALRTSFRAA